MTLELIVNNSDDELEWNKMKGLDVSCECTKCRYRWQVRMEECIGEIKCPKCETTLY